VTEHRTELLPSKAGPPSRQALTLLVLEGPDAGTRVSLGEQPLRIGKDPSSDLLLPDATVSRHHCVIERREENTVVRDLGSTNGTYVNDLRVTEAFLRPGSRLSVGKVVLLLQPVFQVEELAPTEKPNFGKLCGQSLAMRRIFAVMERIAPTEATVLLCGETGTGKGATARALHEASTRKEAPFVVFDCGAVSPTLIEADLFGAEKGAYTGAHAARRGACEEANTGTLFLDEIDDLPLELQPKLLRVLEERELRRLGSQQARKLDIRVIAASKLNLETMVREGRFREDLFYRLAVVRIDLPRLRNREADLPALSDLFMAEEGAWDRLSETLRSQLESHPWPGNLRELRNVLERLRYLGLQDAKGVTLTSGAPNPEREESSRTADDSLAGVDFDLPFKDAKDSLVEAFEHAYLEKLLERAKGNIALAAREAHLNRKYFYDLLRKHGLYAKSPKSEE